ncbi:MAG: hypothetical protein K6U80_09640 [Firmicutes bacterium]|nr:hypothetical protein [Bacillota bacterium]
MEFKVADLINEADELMETAEERIHRQFYSAYPLMRQAVEDLFKAFLTAKGQKPKGILGKDGNPGSNAEVLFEQCLRLEPEFEIIEEIAGYFTLEAPPDPDPELICDAANEIWDFVTGLLSGEDEGGEEEADEAEE